ncbi:DoxX family protein [Tessaracoccus antarcticus]|uniref:DoxX family membrane protein n=1 Tax=Tessaracoccus antarcticus TaxID=2479848 RepID=A0A3M0GBZ5_9ACTN|nr:DoxX family membrane protein [Tessaracoccus antarcticus]RMB59043.1 DoxX family membrane protein [Tessaracoccus antarcticus]
MPENLTPAESHIPQTSRTIGLARTVGRIALGAFLIFAGTGHLTFARESFQGQVPDWIPVNKDLVVVASGFVEIALGAALIFARKWRVAVGWVVAAFFVAVFPGNISQLVTHNDSFGLDTDLKRWLRLPFQPVLIVWALWSTGAWRARR